MLVSVGSDKSVNKVIISGQPYFMELYDIGSVRVVQKSVYCFLSPSNLELVRPEGTLFEKSASSIRSVIAFMTSQNGGQDGRHGSKMAAMTSEGVTSDPRRPRMTR